MVVAGEVPRATRPGSVGSSVLASMAGKAAEMVTLLLLATLVPRVLGPRDFGRFSVPLTVVTLGSLALTLGGSTLMARYVPAAAPAERLAVARAIGARLARGRALQVAVVAAAALAASAVVPDAPPLLDTALVVVAVAANVATTLALQVGLGMGRTGAWSTRYPLQNAVLIATVLGLRGSAGGTGGVVAVLVAALVGVAFAGVTTGWLLRAEVPPAAVPDGAIRFGALQATGAALVQYSHRAGVLAAALLAGSAAQTGYTALATGVALGVTYAVLQAFTVSLPHLAAGASTPTPRSGDPDRRQDVDRGIQNGGGAGVGPAPAEVALRRLAGGLLAVLLAAGLVGALLLDELVPLVFGDRYEAAVDAFAPALALVVLAPLNALAVQAAALRLRPEAAAAAGAAAALGFTLVALVAVPAWGAAGATGAALAGAVASAAVSVRMLPGAIGSVLTAGSFTGSAAVLVLATLA